MKKYDLGQSWHQSKGPASRHISEATLGKPRSQGKRKPRCQPPAPTKRDFINKITPASCCRPERRGKRARRCPRGRAGDEHPGHGERCSAPALTRRRQPQAAEPALPAPHPPCPTRPAPRRRHSLRGAICCFSFTTPLTYFFHALLWVGARKGRSTAGGSDN